MDLKTIMLETVGRTEIEAKMLVAGGRQRNGRKGDQ